MDIRWACAHDIVLMNLRMPVMDSLTAERASPADDPNAGARGYLLKVLVVVRALSR